MNSDPFGPWKAWKALREQKDEDPELAAALAAKATAEVIIEERQQRFRDLMAPLEAEMLAMVEESGSGSIEAHGVSAAYRAGRKTVSWKAVAVALDAPDELIAKHTSHGAPTLAVKML